MKKFNLDEKTLRSSIEFAVIAEQEGVTIAGHEREPDSVLSARLFATAAWSCLVEPGDSVAAGLVAALGAADALQLIVDRASPEVIVAAVSAASAYDGGSESGGDISAVAEGIARWQPRLDSTTVLQALSAAQRGSLSFVTPSSALWPHALDDLGLHAPLCLWGRGEALTASAVPTVAIVGARAATSYGEHVAMELSADLTARGVLVVSGAAYGIDGMAHRAALAAGGQTIAVLAGGADRSYPAGHADLLDRVAASGAVVSELPPGAAPTRWRFLQRNRIIAALGQATVVVEAGWRSGSLNTAAHAATIGRPLGAVPGPVTSAASAGCHRLLRDFDARCVTNADQVVELIGGTSIPSRSTDALTPAVSAAHGCETSERPPTDDTSRVLDALSTRSWRASAELARRAGMSLDDAEATLGLLSLDGRALRSDDGWRSARGGGG